MSLRETENALLLAYDAGFINTEEFCLLYDVNSSTNLVIPYWNYEKFDLERMTNDECLVEFRFQKGDIIRLSEALRIPDTFTSDNRAKFDGLEAFCLLLKRLAYPCRYADLVPRFGRGVPQLSLMFNQVLQHIYDLHKHRLTSLQQPWLSPHCLQKYADAVHMKGAPLSNCWGFIDGTVRPVCRPVKDQRCIYNGHKRVHALKFQSVVAPNGLIANLFGPVEGRRHDSALLRMSGLLDELVEHSHSPEGEPMCIYGDPAYPLRVHLMAPVRGARLTPEQEAFNKSMSSVRTSVEWVFGDIVNYFAHVDFKKNLKIGLSAVGKMYTCCALIHNAHTCLYGSTTSLFFDLLPPPLEDYFQV